MEINIKLYGTLRDRCPEGTALGQGFPLNVKDNATITDALIDLKISNDEVRVVLVNSNIIKDFNYQLKPSDLFVCFPPIGGG